jgi:hypothetical protein
MIRRLVLWYLVLLATLAGCRAGPSDQAVAALAVQLKEAFPNQIETTAWENAPPMDPPLIYVEFKAGQPDAELVALLCEEIKPRVIAVHPDIEVFADGWSLSENCA